MGADGFVEGQGVAPSQVAHHPAQRAHPLGELVAGIVIGFGIGYGLDVLLGTLPLFLVLFVLLGFAAGVRVMLRSVKEIQAQDEGN